MPIVNYVREHTRFIEYASDEHLTASERLLWYALMHIFNQRAQGNVWPDEFIRISNDRLLTYLPMKFDTMAAARNGLKQRGLIEVSRGEKNKFSPSYRMNYFYPQYVSPATDADGETSYPKKSDYIGGNIGDNTGGNIGGNIGDNTGGNMGDIYINYINPKRNPNIIPEEEEDEDESEAVYARARAEIEQSWTVHFGQRPAPALVRRIVIMAAPFAEGVLDEAIELTAKRNTQDPLKYIQATLADWSRHNVKTRLDAQRYQIIREALRGDTPFMTAEEAQREEAALWQAGTQRRQPDEPA